MNFEVYNIINLPFLIIEEYSYDLKTVYCPNGFDLDPIFEDHVKPYVEGTHLIQYCQVVIDRAILCKKEQTCKAFHYNMKDCGYPKQDISCVKNTTGKFKQILASNLTLH